MNRITVLNSILDRSKFPFEDRFLADTVGHYTSTYQKQLKVSFGGHCCINVADGSLHGFAKNVLPSHYHERESKASESSFQVLRPNVKIFCTK